MREHVQIINACKCLNELRFDLMGPCIFTSGHNQISCCKSNLEKGLNNCHKKVYFITFSFKKEGGGFGTGKLSQEVFPQPSLQLAGVLLIEDWSLCQLNQTRQPPPSVFPELQCNKGQLDLGCLIVTSLYWDPVQGHSKKGKEITMSLISRYNLFH